MSAVKEVNLSEAYDNQLLELADIIISLLLFYSWIELSYFFYTAFSIHNLFHLAIKIQKQRYTASPYSSAYPLITLWSSEVTLPLQRNSVFEQRTTHLCEFSE